MAFQGNKFRSLWGGDIQLIHTCCLSVLLPAPYCEIAMACMLWTWTTGNCMRRIGFNMIQPRWNHCTLKTCWLRCFRGFVLSLLPWCKFSSTARWWIPLTLIPIGQGLSTNPMDEFASRSGACPGCFTRRVETLFMCCHHFETECLLFVNFHWTANFM